MPDKITATAADAANTQSQAGTSEQVPAAEPVARPATVFGFGPQDSEPVGAAEDFGENTQTGEDAPEEGQNIADAQAPGDELNTKPQREIGAYWRKERERRDREIERAKQEFEQKLSGDPIRQLGQLMIDNIASREGKTPDEAAKIAEERFIAAYAKQEGMTPAQARLDLVAKRLLSANAPDKLAPQKPTQQKPAESPDDVEAEAEAQAMEIVEELASMRFPGGFDLDVAMQDQSFQNLLIDYGPKAAVRIYAAEQTARQAPQQIADKLRARQQIPQTIRPQQAVSPVPSYRDMSSEEFFAEKERLLKKLNG